MSRYIGQQEACELFADGWYVEIVEEAEGHGYKRAWDGKVPGDLFVTAAPRKSRTEPPAKIGNDSPERRHCERTYAVGDIVTGDEAYRLVELGAKVSSVFGPGTWEYWRESDGADRGGVMFDFVSHTRRTLWNPDADEWRIVEPPKTITAEEARKVVAAGGAVARTFVAPESEWMHKHDWSAAKLFDASTEWVVRRAAPAPSLPVVDAAEARRVVVAGGAVSRSPTSPESDWVTLDNYEVAMGPLHPGEWVVRRAAQEKPSALTAEELGALKWCERELTSDSARIVCSALRRLAGEMGK